MSSDPLSPTRLTPATLTPAQRAAIPVLTVHPGAAHFIYELVAAVEALGFDGRFETGFFHDPHGLLARLASYAPPGLRSRLMREFSRRSFAGISPRRVIGHPLPELLYVAAARSLAHKPEIPRRLMAWRNRVIDGAAARRILRDRPRLVIGHDTSAIASIRAARAVGAKSILNQMIGHVAIGDRILREEAALQPAWADSLHAGAPDWLIDQCIAEAREADAVLVPSDYVRQTMIDVGTAPERIKLLPFGVRVDRFAPLAEAEKAQLRGADGKFRLLYVGQISQRKGLSYALEAVKRLNDPAVELVLVGGMVGEGRGLKPYDGLYRHIRNVPHAEVQTLFQTADAFVYPSLHEGSALAIFEAMASGLPVITTVNSGSMVRDGIDGALVPIRDPDAIAAQIARLKQDEGLRRTQAANARDRALSFTWDQYRITLSAILDDLCA